jgi:acetyl-CoA carboxylase biotin carboxyl carrier protein
MSMIEGTDVVEVELEEAGRKVRVRRGEVARAIPHTQAPAAPAQAPAPAGQGPAAPAPVAEANPSHHIMKSPIVGTYYRAADPAAPPFVKVGDTVRKGQVLCIVEAMKLMNEIESDVAGEILKVHPENGHPVQFGEPLFTIKTA